MCALASGIEKLRLTTLHRYAVLDTEPEDAFDDMARLAATACRTPFAWIGFVDGDRLWFKSTAGFERDEIPRDFALCDDALKHSDVLIVRDTRADGRYARSPLVADGPRVRFYAAAPLVTPDGYALGCIAVADCEPRDLEPAQADALRALARQIIRLLEARLAETLHRRAVGHASDIIYMTDERGLFTFVNPVAVRILGYELDELLGRHYLELIRPDFRAAVEELYSNQFKLRERTTYFEFPALAKDGSEVWFGQNVQLVTEGGHVTGFHAVARDITLRKRVQDALRQSEERLRQALQAAQGGTWDYDLRTETFSWSDEFYRLLGHEPGSCEPTVENWLRCVHPDDRERVRVQTRRALRTYNEVEVEYRVLLPDGAVRWLHGKGKKVPGEAGGLTRYAGVVLDVTARKTAEEEARRSAEYAKLFRYANDAILVLDPESGEILDVNEKACEAYGRSREEFVGDRLASISANPARELRLFAGHAESGECLEFEAQHTGSGGRVIHLHVNASFINYHGRRAVLSINRDITGRKAAEDALRLSEAKYRQLIEQASDGIVLLRHDGEILEVNTRFCEITGGACEDLVGRNLADFLLTEDLEASPLRLGELLDGERLLTEHRIRRADGAAVPVEINARMLSGADRTILAIVRDTTARKRAEEMLRRGEQHLFKAQRMEAIGQLAGGVAHDFNNIITGVFGFTDLARRLLDAMETPDNAQQALKVRRNLDEVELAGRRGAGLTRQLLAFSRQQQLARRTVDINHAVSNLLGLLRRLIEENVTMHFYPGADKSTVFADLGQIEQVMVNLAANARDAMPKGGQLIIETANVTLDDAYVERHPYAVAGKYLQIRVSDTGTGMPEDVRARIFEPFFTTKDVDKGTGLGLSTVYGIVKQHDGTIEVYTEPGHGTTFKIYLPLESGTAEEPVEHAAPRLVGGAETILVAEDDPSLERLTRQYLEELGYRVIITKDGRDAVKVYEARHHEIDLILLDVIMPGLDGPDALREMRELVPDTAPVVFMTGYSPEVVRERLEEELSAGAGLLQKPYEPAELGVKVREALDARRGERDA